VKVYRILNVFISRMTNQSYWRGLAGTNQELVKASAGGLDHVRQERMAPEQTPEGPVPAHVPLPRSRCMGDARTGGTDDRQRG
jgi:hypothetical protein